MSGKTFRTRRAGVADTEILVSLPLGISDHEIHAVHFLRYSMMKNLFCVKDRVVAITGATGVLGRSMVLHFAEQGARVVLMGRKAETGLALQREAAAAGGDALFVAADVLNNEDIERAYRVHGRNPNLQ